MEIWHSKKENIGWLKIKLKKISIIFLSFLLILLQIRALEYIYDDVRNKNYMIRLEETKRYFDYITSNPNKIYVYDMAINNNYHAFLTYPDNKPYNMLFYGGSTIYSELWYLQLQVNGLENDVYSDLFLKDNVYYISNECDTIYQYLSNIYGNVNCEIIENLNPEIQVYKFSLN